METRATAGEPAPQAAGESTGVISLDEVPLEGGISIRTVARASQGKAGLPAELPDLTSEGDTHAYAYHG